MKLCEIAEKLILYKDLFQLSGSSADGVGSFYNHKYRSCIFFCSVTKPSSTLPKLWHDTWGWCWRLEGTCACDGDKRNNRKEHKEQFDGRQGAKDRGSVRQSRRSALECLISRGGAAASWIAELMRDHHSWRTALQTLTCASAIRHARRKGS